MFNRGNKLPQNNSENTEGQGEHALSLEQVAAEFSEIIQQYSMVPGIKKIIECLPASPAELCTPGNLTSITGFLFAVDGAKNITTTKGVKQIAVGRSLDMIDGTIARATNTASEFGAMLDATLDKLAIAIILYESWRQQALPKEVIIATAAQQLGNALVTLLFNLNHPDNPLKPDRFQKYALAGQHVPIAKMLYDNATATEQGREYNPRQTWAYYSALGLTAVSALGTVSYIRQAKS